MKKLNSSGQALVLLLFAIAFSITIFTSVTITAISLGKSTFLNEQGSFLYYSTEAGIDYGLMRLVRQPTSCNSTNDLLTVDNASVTVSYSLAGSTCTVTSTAISGTVQKSLQIQATLSNQKVTTCCSKELP